MNLHEYFQVSELLFNDCVQKTSIKTDASIAEIKREIYEMCKYPYIEGPYLLIVMESGKRKFLIFGEKHFSTPHCSYPRISIEKFLFDFVKRNKFIDLFLEKDIRNRFGNKGSSASNPSKIKDIFGCYGKCKENLRVHYVDPRALHVVQYILSAKIRNMDEAKSFIDSIESFYNHTKVKLEDYDFNDLIRDSKLDKQISSSQYKSHLLGVREKLRISLNAIAIELVRIVEKYEKSNRSSFEQSKFMNDLNNATAAGFSLYSQLLDVYTVARMTRTFKQTSAYSKPPKNIVFYGGGNHSKNIVAILQDLGIKVTNVEEGENCVKFKPEFEF